MGFDDDVREAKAEKRRAAAEIRAWRASIVSSVDTPVTDPPAEYATLIEELIGHIPRRHWKAVVLGTGPDGVLRIVGYPKNLSYLRRATAAKSACFRYEASYGKDESPSCGIDLFRDGRVGNCFGPPDVLREHVITFIA